ncbi:MAG: MFS transporter [Sporolactobacillus sp.]
MNKKSFVLLIIIVSANLRLAITAIVPLFGLIQSSFNVSSTYTALLISSPLLCFAVGAIITPKLIQLFGNYRLLIMTTLLLSLANVIRPTNVWLMLLGTVLVGFTVAALNVSVPALIVMVLPREINQLTSYYSLSMNVFAALTTAAVLPIASATSWQQTIRLLTVPALLSLGYLVFNHSAIQENQLAAKTPDRVSGVSSELWRDRYAWLLTGFMGMQSLTYYSLNTWLPDIATAQGVSLVSAGLMLSVFQLVGIPAALLVSFVSDQRILLTLIGLGYAGGISGLLVGCAGLWAGAVLLGFTGSLIFTLALAFINSSSVSSTVVAQRSGFAQCLGYLLASAGPVFFGRINTLMHSWLIGLIIFAVLMALTVGLGIIILLKQHRV